MGIGRTVWGTWAHLPCPPSVGLHPAHQREAETGHQSPSRNQDKLPTENGLGSTSERENGRLHDVPAVTINGMIAGDEELLEDDKEFYRESSSSLSCGKETLDSSSSTYESHDRSHDSSLNQPSDKSNSRDVDSYLLYPHDPEEVVMSSCEGAVQYRQGHPSLRQRLLVRH